jgi:hypothetical protein
MAKKSDLEVWAPIALADPGGDGLTLSVPLHVLFGEAVDLAKFHEKYWEGGGAGPQRALKTAVNKRQPGRFTAKTGDKILSLQRACIEANTAYRLAVEGTRESPKARGEELLAEVTGALEWLFDDGVEDENDAKLAKLASEHEGDPDTNDALALALDEYAALASEHRDDLEGLGGFEVKSIDEARDVAKALRDQPAAAELMSAKTKAALGLRNRLVRLLQAEMSLVRAAAKFVFRAEPEIAREATSAYERRRRASAARKSRKDNKDKAERAPSNGVNSPTPG